MVESGVKQWQLLRVFTFLRLQLLMHLDFIHEKVEVFGNKKKNTETHYIFLFYSIFF